MHCHNHVTDKPKEKELLITSVTPQNIERGDVWFAENLAAIKKSLGAHLWWRDNALLVETDLSIRPPLLVRRLLDFGYERASRVCGRGLFALHSGGIIEVWPVNSAHPWTLEFNGNTIIQIHERPSQTFEAKPRYYGGLASMDSIEKLATGAFVVHTDHGIGIYREVADNYFVIEYAPPGPGRTPDRLMVPRDQHERISAYMGFDTPRIHRLGGSLWPKTRRKIKEETEKLARELLELYAARHEAQRPAYEPDEALMDAARSTFPYQETPDQLAAEERIMADLARTDPMDRIICGDVGFGKTEVAVRAALAVITSGRQVAVLSPTTVLAAQHEKTFASRFAQVPVRIKTLSRLTPKQEQKTILDELRSGAADCIIGTHRLLSQDIVFKNLGLVIIDEEQRFGVKQKERFKQMRAAVDILSLSATPIPRTLSLAMAKLRDISLLSTPPPERIAIQTHVLPGSERIIREAIVRELERGGQVYFLHNRIETIGAAKNKLENILARGTAAPKEKPRIATIHGRMGEGELIQVMDRFRRGEINILIATTIIENGLDISSANTLIVDNAVRLGLTQAHQLRGRIGRGSQQAFAYFLYQPRHLTPKAAERLDALHEYAKLGSGYQIALRDLEIRGAGNILGREQSGAINKVGLNLYCQMLADAVEQIKNRQ